MNTLPAINMNEEMGRAFAKTMWAMIDDASEWQDKCKELYAENTALKKEIKKLRAHAEMRDNQWLHCQEIHGG